VWAGVDSVWEQKKLEARKMLVNRAESPASSARFVGQVLQGGFEFNKTTRTRMFLRFWKMFFANQIL
jgi:hypothetical protein